MTLALGAVIGSADCSEHDLVALVRRGDDRGFEELYPFVLGMVGDHGRTEDVTQEVFISALRRMRETERPIAFKPWIYEIAKNACIDNARRTRRVQEVSLNAEPEAQPEAEASLRAPTLESTLEARQQLSDLRGAFGCLSENHHRILVMRELEGHPTSRSETGSVFRGASSKAPDRRIAALPHSSAARPMAWRQPASACRELASVAYGASFARRLSLPPVTVPKLSVPTVSIAPGTVSKVSLPTVSVPSVAASATGILKP